MTSVEVKGTGWHRVKIGPYETLDEAESILPKVKKFKGDAFIMKHD
jgi:cell division protein FtsN